MAFITCVPLFYLPFYVRNSSLPCVALDIGTDDGLFFTQMRHVKRFRLALILTFVLPFYTIAYLFGVFDLLNQPQIIVVYHLLSLLTKGIFTSVAMEIHSDTFLQMRRLMMEHNERSANEARRAFLKYIFHEVRNPLNSLSIGIEVLSGSRNLDTSDKESISMMRNASQFMSDTLNDVLSMQKIEEGKLQLEMAPFSICDAIAKVLGTFRAASQEKNVTVYKNISPKVPHKVIGDRYRIEHLIANLLSNAIKFSPENSAVDIDVNIGHADQEEVSAKVSAKIPVLTHSDSTVLLVVAVKDRGPGISVEDQQKLFHSYVQVRPGQLQKGRGSGLGLALCKQIVSLHGGTIEVNSVEGKGSVFQFSIPLKVYSSQRISQTLLTQYEASDEQMTEVTEIVPRTSFVRNAVGDPDLSVLVVDGKLQ